MKRNKLLEEKGELIEKLRADGLSEEDRLKFTQRCVKIDIEIGELV